MVTGGESHGDEHQQDGSSLSRRRLLQISAGAGVGAVLGGHITGRTRAVDSEVFEGFEDGHLDEWTVHDTNFGVYDSQDGFVYQGTYSAGIETSSAQLRVAETIPAGFDGGRRPESISYWWYDRAHECGRGGGLSIVDSNGNEILGVASDNPEWGVIDASGPTGIGESGEYGTWTHFEITFDWEEGTYAFAGEDEAGNQQTHSGDLRHNTDVETLAFQSTDPQFRSNGWTAGESACIWYDNLRIEYEKEVTFDVSITETNSPIDEGETLEVDVDVENTGDESGTQTVALDVDGQEVDSTTVELGGGESQTVTLDWQTADGDDGSYQVTARSDDATDQTGVTVEEVLPPQFSVDIGGTNEPVSGGETLEVDVDVENTGDESGTQTVSLEADGQEVDSTTLELGGGESQTVTLDWETEDGDVGDSQITVASDDESDQLTVTVHRLAGFLVTIAETNAPVESGETLEVTATVENTSESTDTQDITLEVNGQQGDTAPLTLASGESKAVVLGWQATDRNGVGVRVASEDDIDNSHVALTSSSGGGETAIEIIGASTTGSDDETLEATVEITNLSDDELTQDVHFDVDAQREETREVTLGPGESTIETFTSAVGDRTSAGLRAASADDWDNRSLLLVDTDVMPTGL